MSSFGKLVGGRLCLDFVNTVGGRVSGPRPRGRDFGDHVLDERLTSYDAILRWAVLAGALTRREARDLAASAAERPGAAADVLRRAQAVREAMYRVFKARVEGWRPLSDDLETLNAEIRQARTRERLIASPRMAWAWEESAALDRPLWPVVTSAADLLTSPFIERVRQCPGEDCGWLFLDTSRAGRRTWCDMADCGTLAKVRRFRQKRRRPRGRPSSRP